MLPSPRQGCPTAMTRPVTAAWTSACALLLDIAPQEIGKHVSSEPGPHRSSLKRLGWEGKEDATSLPALQLPFHPFFKFIKLFPAELKNA